MKLPPTSTIVNREIDKVFGFLSDPKYLNLYPKLHGVKVERIEHLNSLPYGLGKQLRLRAEQGKQKISADIEIYKFTPPKELGFKVLETYNRKGAKTSAMTSQLFGDMEFDLVLEEVSGKTLLKSITYFTSVNSLFMKFLMYVFFGLVGYRQNKRYLKELGELIERNT